MNLNRGKELDKKDTYEASGLDRITLSRNFERDTDTWAVQPTSIFPVVAEKNKTTIINDGQFDRVIIGKRRK